MQSAARSYFQTQVTTTTQGDLVILLFDAALKFLHQAKEKMLEKNYAQKGILLSRALDILAELQGSLNAQKGGELADRLQKLYFYCSSSLLTANLKMDTTKVDEVVGILGHLRDAFSQANAKVTTNTVPSSATQGTGRISGNTPPPPTRVLPNPRLEAVTLARPAAAAPQAAPGVVTTVAVDRQAQEVFEQAPLPSMPPVSPDMGRPAVLPLRRVMAAYAASRASE